MTSAPAVRRPAVLTVLGVVLATLGLAIAGPPSAQAGDYKVAYCRDEAGNPRQQLPDWDIQGSSQVGDQVVNGCGEPGGGMRADWTNPASSRPPGQFTGWTLKTKDSGISIVGWNVYGRASIGANDSAFSLVADNPNPNLAYVGKQCRTWQGCTSPDTEVGGTWSGSTTSLSMVLGCAVNPPKSTCDGGAASVVERNVVTYRDATAPTSSGVVRSALTNGGLLSGTVRIAGAATDAGVGMRRLALQVDGQEVASSEEVCRPPYDRQQPCISGLDTAFEVDTTKVSDGPHGATVVAVDGADNGRILWSGNILVGNAGLRGPGSDITLRGAPNGNYASDAARITAGWPATSRGPSRSKAVQRRCKRSAAYRRRHDVACNGRPGKRQLTISYSAKKQNLVRGRLLTDAGTPIAGAAVQILASPRAVGLAPRVVSQPTTDADGRFVGRVPASLGSATLSVNWLARARDTVPAATISMRRTVRATTTFSASPKRSVRRGRKLVLRGTLRATTGVRQGNAIAIQANAGNGWRAVKTVRSDERGRWRAEYVVPTQLRGSYRFRAVVTPSASYPFGIGNSASRTIRVR